MTMQVRPLTETFGTEIAGLDLTQQLAETAGRDLYRHFAGHAVLVFRDQKLDPPQFAAAARLERFEAKPRFHSYH
jgi:taurine dioxygenase